VKEFDELDNEVRKEIGPRLQKITRRRGCFEGVKFRVL
jgi:hypothetical protein